MKLTFFTLLVFCSGLFAQGNFNVEWESPTFNSYYSYYTQFEESNAIPEIVVMDGATILVYDGSTKALKYQYSNPDRLYFNNFIDLPNHSLDVNDDGTYDFIITESKYTTIFNYYFRVINAINGQIFFQNVYSDYKGSTEAIDIDGDGYVELCITLTHVQGQIYTSKIMILSTPAHVISVEPSGKKVTEYNLEQNYPNPFNSSTAIEYSVSKETDVNLNIYDETGQLVKNIAEGKKNAGSYKVVLELNDIASGVYFYQLVVDGIPEAKKMVLVK